MSGDPSKFDWSFASLKTLVIVVSVAVVVIFVVLGTANLSSTETVLLGVVQTFFSLLVGWVITHEYAKRSEANAVRDIEELHQKNLRTYALKAAEKVENLSRELSRLGVYLNQELDGLSRVGSSKPMSGWASVARRSKICFRPDSWLKWLTELSGAPISRSRMLLSRVSPLFLR